jgi:hypothetical protein
MQMQTILKRNPEPLAVDMDGETVMMDMESGNYFGINSVGSYIWNLLENECTLQSILDSVQQHFEINNDDTVEADITAFLSDMLEQNLIETADES